MQENENKTILSETQTDNNSVAVFDDAQKIVKPKTTRAKNSTVKTESGDKTTKTTSKRRSVKNATHNTEKTTSIEESKVSFASAKVSENETINVQAIESEPTQIIDFKNNKEINNFFPETEQTENISETENVQNEKASFEIKENETSEMSGENSSLPNIEINSNVSIPDKEKTSIVKTIEIITGSTVFRYVLGAMIIFAMCFITSLFTFNIVLVPVEVQGYSMLPTINASASGDSGETYTDIVYISKSKNIHYKDIVVIKGGKTPSGKQIIKRVIATPGDTLTFKKVDTTYEYGQIYFVVDIYLNGNKLNENYTKEAQTKIQNTYESSKYYEFYNDLVAGLKNTNTNETVTAGEFTITMGKDEYFVMGDNRNSYNIADERSHGSIDSRMFGTVKKDEIIGKVAIQVKYGKNMLESIWQAIFGTRLQNV